MVAAMKPRVVQLFVTCLVDSLFPEVGESVVTILERQGIRVEFPFDQTCCGQPAFNAGFPTEAAAMARHTVDVLHDTEGPIVVPSGSCAQMIIHHGPELLSDDEASGRSAAVAARTRELTAFLADDLGLTDLGTRPQPERMTYHPSCHGLRGLGLSNQATDLLKCVDGLELVVLPEADTCCGFGGVFSVEMPEVSAAMLDSKLANVLSTGADVLVGGDVGCLMHMGGGLRRRDDAQIRVLHVAEVLAGDAE